MKIVSWNVNSVRARLTRVTDWLALHQPDILCLQETKVPDADFPRIEIESMGYTTAFYGQKAYNGVALLARGDLLDVKHGFDGGDETQKRVISALFKGIRVINIYVPNGASVGSEKYEYKLNWLEKFRTALDKNHSSGDPLLICGDFNIAPEGRDTWDPKRWDGKILCSEPERDHFQAMLEWGLSDALRLHNQESDTFTWWDYRMGGFRKNWGLRIDHFLVTKPVAKRIRTVQVDKDERGGEKPSDHAPVILELD